MKILIVEDNEDIQQLFSDWLKGRFLILAAYTIEQAERLFRANQDIRAIALDACLCNGGNPDTIPLARKIRQIFFGPMIAIANMEEHRELLMKAGCDHQCPKEAFPRKLIEILGV